MNHSRNQKDTGQYISTKASIEVVLLVESILSGKIVCESIPLTLITRVLLSHVKRDYMHNGDVRVLLSHVKRDYMHNGDVTLTLITHVLLSRVKRVYMHNGDVTHC